MLPVSVVSISDSQHGFPGRLRRSMVPLRGGPTERRDVASQKIGFAVDERPTETANLFPLSPENIHVFLDDPAAVVPE